MKPNAFEIGARHRAWWRKGRKAPRPCWPVFLVGFLVGAATVTAGVRLSAETRDLQVGREAVEQWEAEREAREWRQSAADSVLEAEDARLDSLGYDWKPLRLHESYPGQAYYDGTGWHLAP